MVISFVGLRTGFTLTPSNVLSPTKEVTIIGLGHCAVPEKRLKFKYNAHTKKLDKHSLEKFEKSLKNN